jgi:hypothetical protein
MRREEIIVAETEVQKPETRVRGRQDTPTLLTEEELDRIVDQLSSIRDRAALTSHIALLGGWRAAREQSEARRKKNNADASQQAVSAPSPAPSDTAKQIAAWIRATWPGETVRAKMAQKIADMIDENAWQQKE